MKQKICKFCKGKFSAKRSWHIYCSERCGNRVRYNRLIRRARRGRALEAK